VVIFTAWFAGENAGAQGLPQPDIVASIDGCKDVYEWEKKLAEKEEAPVRINSAYGLLAKSSRMTSARRSG